MNREVVKNVSYSVIRIIERIKDIFIRHLIEQNMSYTYHFKIAMKLSLKMALASVLLFIHALFPFLFKTSGSKIIIELSKDINDKKNNKNIYG